MPVILGPPIAGLVGGRTDIAVTGTGSAIPTGIEATLQYGGIIFNRTDVIDKIRVTEIGGFDDADVRDSREVNPGYHGETAFDAWYGGRTITLSGRIEAYSLEKLRDMQMGLRQAFSELVEKPLVVRSYNGQRDVIIRCRKSAPIAMREAQVDMRFFRDFLITLRASNPRFLNYYERVENLDLTGLTTASLEIENHGNFRAAPTIRIFGPITDPSITNNANGETVTLEGTIANLDHVDIDIAGRKIVDASGDSRFGLLDLTSDWLELEPGVNNLDMSLTGAGANTAISIFWRDTWM